ncbi:MAG TPA: imidazole glycerol phosphate synthase subunit HisH [Bryobacteraceae bacterium]|nr:imidazole glycerol phosphate synthase subunit HisH [Bryobacteraceae bacterium]
MIGIFDYGAGNLRSVQNTLDAIGAQYELIRDVAGIGAASKIILPGVGHFGQMMNALDRMQVRNALRERIGAGVPFLGICLGLQALFERSAEAPGELGLALYPGTVERFPVTDRVPHMGWNTVSPVKRSQLLPPGGTVPHFYFAHSYYVPVCPQAAAVCEYSVPYTAVLEQDNVFGVQFHPEKSGSIGLDVVRRFVELC